MKQYVDKFLDCRSRDMSFQTLIWKADPSFKQPLRPEVTAGEE